MHTEEEAKTKWCQETFTSQLIPNQCWGSACMAWRWQYAGRMNCHEDGSPRDDGPLKGYCGKAGKP